MLIIIGSENSSNSLRLVETGKKYGCYNSILIQNTSDIPWSMISKINNLGITASASTPNKLLQTIISLLKNRYNVKIKEINAITESTHFKLPPLNQKATNGSLHFSK